MKGPGPPSVLDAGGNFVSFIEMGLGLVCIMRRGHDIGAELISFIAKSPFFLKIH